MMARVKFVYRVETMLPAGSDEPGWEPPGWHEWCYEHGYADSAVCAVEPLLPGESPSGRRSWLDHLKFSWPTQVHWFSKSAAERSAARVRQWGGTAVVVRSEPIRWAAVPSQDRS
jgi:hypothetical protein